MNCLFRNSRRLPGGRPLGENLAQHVIINYKCNFFVSMICVATFSVSIESDSIYLPKVYTIYGLSHPQLSLLAVLKKVVGGEGGRGREESYIASNKKLGCERQGIKLSVLRYLHLFCRH